MLVCVSTGFPEISITEAVDLLAPPSGTTRLPGAPETSSANTNSSGLTNATTTLETNGNPSLLKILHVMYCFNGFVYKTFLCVQLPLVAPKFDKKVHSLVNNCACFFFFNCCMYINLTSTCKP